MNVWHKPKQIHARPLLATELTSPAPKSSMLRVIQATEDSRTDALLNFLSSNRSNIMNCITEHGGVLFRGFQVDTPQVFETIVRELGITPNDSYSLGRAPRHKVTDYVWTEVARVVRTDFPLR